MMRLQRFLLPLYSGRQELYATRLREKYTGDVPMYSALYTSSESVIGVNLWPKDEPTYLPVLSAAFFEFVPVENCHKEQAKVGFLCTATRQKKCFSLLYLFSATNLISFFTLIINEIEKVSRDRTLTHSTSSSWLGCKSARLRSQHS